jgi:glucose-1-phosphate cytidylyltransferase
VRSYLDDQPFCFTYGDGVADVDITQLIAFHRSEARQATLTAVQPPGRFGSLAFERGRVLSFEEKPQGDGNWINGGFFVLDPVVIDLVDGDHCIWEQRPLQTLAETGQLSAYHHKGFWQPMDTLRDKQLLEELWQNGQAPWKMWS